MPRKRKTYKCGLVAGQRVRLKKELPIVNHLGKVTEVQSAGEVWEVLSMSRLDPVVWLRQPDGERHTWDDSDEIFEFFEVVPR
jgi:hypothetical protein